ncbi:MAG: hypothetical protein R2939_07175 [Kofleriaceae bacterium]
MRLAHLEIQPLSAVERALVRAVGPRAGVVLGKDARLMRRRYPMAWVVGASLWGLGAIVAGIDAVDPLAWTLALASVAGGYLIVLGRRLASAPIDQPRLTEALPLSPSLVARARRGWLFGWGTFAAPGLGLRRSPRRGRRRSGPARCSSPARRRRGRLAPGEAAGARGGRVRADGGARRYHRSTMSGAPPGTEDPAVVGARRPPTGPPPLAQGPEIEPTQTSIQLGGDTASTRGAGGGVGAIRRLCGELAGEVQALLVDGGDDASARLTAICLR